MEAESTKELSRILESHRNELGKKNSTSLTRSEKMHIIKPELVSTIIMKIIFGVVPIILHIVGVPGFTSLVAFLGVGVLLLFDILTFILLIKIDY